MESPEFRGRMPIVAYLTAKQNAVYYRLMLDVLLEEESRLGIHLQTAEIDRRVREKLGSAPRLLAEMPMAESLLESLLDWGNVDRIYNMRRSGTVAEFLHKDFLYQLTSEGALVHRMLSDIDRNAGSAGSLQASTLPEILDAVRGLVRAMDGPANLTACAGAFARLVRGFEGLSGDAKQFVQGLNRSLVVQGQADVESFLAYKEVVVGYLRQFLVALSRDAQLIVGAIAEAEDAGLADLLPRIAAVEAAPQRGMTQEEVAAREASRMSAQWAGLRSWFFETVDRPAVYQVLQQRASDAVHQIVLTVHQLNDQRFRKVDRAADLIRLAVTFDGMDKAPESETGAVWRLKFGLDPARHLSVSRPPEDDEDHLDEASWWEGTPAPVTAGYRSSGPRRRPGPVPRVRSVQRAKSLLAAEHGDSLQRESTAEAALVARGPVSLALLGTLDGAEGEVLLRCLDTAFAVPADEEGLRRATTPDGRLHVTLAPVAEKGIAQVGLRGGSITLSDLELTVRLAGPT